MKQTSTKKKIITGILFGFDVALTLFFLVTSLVMLMTMPDQIERALGHYQDNYIGFLQQNSHLFMFLIVVPMIILFLVNIVAFALYIIGVSKKPLKQ